MKLILFLFGWCIAAAAAAPLRAAPEVNLDARIARDVAAFDFAKVAGGNGENWVVLDAAPDQFTEIESLEINAIYFGDHPPPHTAPVAARAGVVDRLSGDLAGMISCFAELDVPGFPRTKPLYHRYDLFSARQVVICRVTEHPTGFHRVKVEEASLIPREWADQVRPAFEFWRDNPWLTADAEAKDNRVRLVRLLADKNPFLATLACRTLARGGELTFKDIPQTTLDTMDQRGVQALFLVFGHAPPSSVDQLVALINGRIDSAKQPSDLYGFSWACEMDFNAGRLRLKSEGRPCFELLRRISARAQSWPVDGKRDEYLDGILGDARETMHLLDWAARRRAARNKAQ